MSASAVVGIVVARLLSPVREGTAFVDNPIDDGGPTKFGITIDWLTEVRGVPCTVEDIKNLTPADAEAAYATWMMKHQLAALPALSICDAVTDFAVHSGLGTAVEALQRVVGVPVDGGLGPITLAAVAKDDPLAVACGVCAHRVKLWVTDFEKRPSQRAFEDGWMTRLADVLEGMSG